MTTHRVWMLVLLAATSAAADPPKKPVVKDIVQPVKIEKQDKREMLVDLASLAEQLAGTWKCTGPGTATGTTKVALDLDGGWLVESLDVGGKSHLKQVAYISFQSEVGTWTRVVFEPNGELMVGLADGVKDGVMTWTMTDPKGARSARERLDVSDGKTVKLSSEVSTDGKHFTKRYELTCKK